MKLEIGPDGIVIAAEDLGPLLNLDPAVVQGAMRRGEITSTHEQGVGADAGRFRVTFRYKATRLRLTCTDDGTVISRTRTQVAPPADG